MSSSIIAPSGNISTKAILSEALEDALATTISKISAADSVIGENVRLKLNEFTDIDNLGFIPDILTRYLNIRGDYHPTPAKKIVIISCADHGVSEESVSAYPPETTLHMMKNYLISQGGTANAMANFINADLLIADLGVKADTEEVPNLWQLSIAKGTQNMTKGAAMTRTEALKSIITGINIASYCAKLGYNILLPGEMGISNTTASAAIVGAILKLSAAEITGRGTNISDQRLAHKKKIIQQALLINNPDPRDGIDVLSKVGGFEFGCMAGIMLGAAANKMLVVLDGANTTSAALIAHTICPRVSDYLLASHKSISEKSQPYAIERLGLTPFLKLDVRLSEACGSAIATAHLEAMLKLWDFIDNQPAQISLNTREFSEKNDSYDLNYQSVIIPELSMTAREACCYRLDNLTKPIQSLGYLEEIVLQLASVSNNKRPTLYSNAAMLVFSTYYLSPKQQLVTAAFTEHSKITPLIANLSSDLTPITAFKLGHKLTAEKAADCSIISLAVAYNHTTELKNFLLNDDNSLKYSPLEFLSRLPHPLQIIAAAFSGSIVAAAENHCLVILDDEVTEIIARYAVATNPALEPYLLHLSSNIIQLRTNIGGGMINSLGLDVIRAALHMFNDMKTFAEAQVAVANDGLGRNRQTR